MLRLARAAEHVAAFMASDQAGGITGTVANLTARSSNEDDRAREADSSSRGSADSAMNGCHIPRPQLVSAVEGGTSGGIVKANVVRNPEKVHHLTATTPRDTSHVEMLHDGYIAREAAAIASRSKGGLAI